MKSDLSTPFLDSPEPLSKEADLWNIAIADAEELVREAATSIRQLKKSIKIFKQLRDKGAAFPGETSESNDRLMGQERLSGQSPWLGLCLKIRSTAPLAQKLRAAAQN